MPPPRASILIYGRDRQLLETRRLVLERTGARVWTAADISDFIEIPTAASVDLVILCYSLSAEECSRALALATTRWTEVQSLFLISGLCGRHPGVSDQVVDATRGPAHLVDTVAKLVEAKQADTFHTTQPT